MSLVNKMLRDLELRQETGSVAPTPVYQDLKPVGTSGRKGIRSLLVILASVLVLGMAAIYFAAERIRLGPLSKPAVAAPLAKTPTRTNVASSQPAAAPVVAPVVPTTAIREEPRPAVPPEREPQPSTVVANRVESKPALVAPASPSRPAADSQKKSQVSIVATKERIPVPAKRAQPKPSAAISTPSNVATAAPVAATEQVAVVDKKVRPLTTKEKAEAHYRRAVRLLDQGRPENSIEQLREALREQPEHVKARELAAGLALQGGHWREAEKLLEEGLRQVPSHYLFARMLARVYVDHGAEAKALAVMESAAPDGSDDPDFSSLLGLLYQRAGRHADAVEVYKRALALRPNDARTWLGFAISLEGEEKWGAAKSAYQRAKENGGLTPPLLKYADQRLAALQNR